jgi:hypothetical protein
MKRRLVALPAPPGHCRMGKRRTPPWLLRPGVVLLHFCPRGS